MIASPSASPAPLYATTVAIDGVAVLLLGDSGAGKSDLALRLVDRGAVLISDDYTVVEPTNGELVARAPERIAGQMEVRGLGILPFPTLTAAKVALACDLDTAPERLPEGFAKREVAGIGIPLLALAAGEPSAPIKVELALRLLQSGVSR